MKKCLIIVATLCSIQNSWAETFLTLSIDYGPKKPSKELRISYIQGMTALALLQKAASVKTKQLGNYQFVTAIDGVYSRPKKMGWFYYINEKRADKVASDYLLNNVQSMRWEFREDHCLSR